ncbi:septum formation family protein [Nocardioides marmoriginsengisoli]|nr:septum formation family protein [Nocardioides marmoriginsengisoli]
MSSRRSSVLLAVLLVASFALAGCRSDSPGAAPADPGTPTAAPAAAPRVGACYRLDVAAALEATNSARPVGCSQRHNAVTLMVGTIDPVVDGHLLAIDAAPVQRQIAARCRAAVDDHVGGSTETQRLSRVQAVWFSPTLADSDRGALWFRCDLVISGTATAFSDLPRKTRGLLDRSGALDRYGTCGTAAPGTAGFTRVLCSAKHAWRARATIALPAKAGYLGKAAGKAADSACRDVEARRATTSLRLRWSFEWPTKTQWQAGQRHGLCWTPD